MAIAYILAPQLSHSHIIPLEEGVNLVPQLLEKFPHGFPGNTVKVYNGIDELDTKKALEWVVSNEDKINIRLYPQDVVSGTITVVAIAIAAFAAVAGFLNIDSSDPNRDELDTPSGTNIPLQRNRARPGGRIPDMFGTMLHYPDLLAPGYDTYWNNRQITHELFCIGIGDYGFWEAKLGEQPLRSDFAFVRWLSPETNQGETAYIGASEVPFEQQGFNVELAQFEQGEYAPFQVPVGSSGERGVPLVILYRNPTVGREELIAPDEAAQPDPSDVSNSDVNAYFCNNCIYPETWRGSFHANPGAIAKFPQGSVSFPKFVKFSDAGNNNGLWQILGRFIGTNIDDSYIEIAGGNSIVDENQGAVRANVSFSITSRENVGGFTSFNGDTIEIHYTESIGRSSKVGNILEIRFTDGAEYDHIAPGVSAKGPLEIYDYSQRSEQVPGDNGDFRFYDRLRVRYFNGTSPNWSPGTSPGSLTYYALSESIRIDSTDPGQAGDNWVRFDVPFDTPDEVWFDIEHPSGLYLQEPDQNLDLIINQFDVEIRKIADDSLEHYEQIAITGASRDRIRRTYRRLVESTNGPFYIRSRRVTPKFSGSLRDQEGQYQDDAFLVRVAGATHWSGYKHPDPITMFYLSLNSSNFDIPNSSERKLNFLIGRKIGKVTGGAVTPGVGQDVPVSWRMADAMAYTAISEDQGNWPEGDVDLATLEAIQQDLDTQDIAPPEDNPALLPGFGQQGIFNYVFDRRISVEEQLKIIGNIARVYPVRAGRTLTFVRDEWFKPPAGVFNRRNKSPEGVESRAFSFSNPEDYDGVQLTWVDPDADWRQRIYSVPEGITLYNPKKIDLIGCTNWAQAYRRAWFEWNVLQFRRDTLTMSVTEEGRFLMPFDPVMVADNILTEIADGEVVSYNNSTNQVTLDRDISDALSIFSIPIIRIRDTVGTTVIEGNIFHNNGNVFDVIPSIPLSNLGTLPTDSQLKWLYAISEDSGDTQDVWLVSNISSDDRGYTKLECVNYSIQCYLNDHGFSALPPYPVYSPFKG